MAHDRGQPSVTSATLKRLLIEALSHDEVSLDSIASRMFISTRTLQRRLEERETSWRDEVEAVRTEQTLRLLTETDLTVHSVASRVGYADGRRAAGRVQGETQIAATG